VIPNSAILFRRVQLYFSLASTRHAFLWSSRGGEGPWRMQADVETLRTKADAIGWNTEKERVSEEALHMAKNDTMHCTQVRTLGLSGMVQWTGTTIQHNRDVMPCTRGYHSSILTTHHHRDSTGARPRVLSRHSSRSSLKTTE
jgi:hypothetical protein